MKDWPRLPEASLKAIETAEQAAKSALANNIKQYTPGNPEFRRTIDNLREGGYRAIDYICAYAETVFDAFAGQYAKMPADKTVAHEVLAQRVAKRVGSKAVMNWGAFLLATGGGLVKRGVKKVLIRDADKSSVPEFEPVLDQLNARFLTQLQGLLQDRICRWESRWAAESAGAGIQPLDGTKLGRANAAIRTRRYALLKQFRNDKGISTMADHARRAGMSVTAIQGMVAGDRSRYSEEKLSAFLAGIGVSPNEW
jgi:hypothetical protein